MNREPDVVLQLSDGTLPAHSQLLKLWSEPLAAAVDALPAAGGRDRVLPLEATVNDWCAVAAMLYPVAEPATMSWDIVEAVAVLADKYNIPSLLQRAATFLLSNINDMGAYSNVEVGYVRCPCGKRESIWMGFACSFCGYTPKSYTTCEQKDIWKWVQLSERLRMVQLMVECISCTVRHHRTSVTAQRLAGLSSTVKDLMLLEMSNPGQADNWLKEIPPELEKQRLGSILEQLGYGP
jgi:hypothetical protein